ncbi:transglutaminase, partial [Rubrivivax gelatinosus]|nr:transglutaminase [Rubrivivax gelatinosus]
MKAGGPTAFFGRLPPPTAEERAAVRRAAPWVGLALALGMAPAALVLPVWVTVLLAALLGFKTLAVRRGWSVGARVVLPLAAAVLGAWGLGFAAGWMRAPAVLAFFCLVLALKWLEADARGHRRDRIVLLLAAGVLAALGALQQPALASLALLVGYAFALAAALIALQGADRPARRAGALLALALPPAALLFVLTPRVPGPLWDFGLALGLPIAVQAPRSGPGLGARDSLEPGTAAGDGLDSGTALVARFDGWVPPAAALYWRGPVFTRYDGQRWLAPAGAGSRRERMAGGHRRSADWLARVQTRGQALGYTLRVAGHGGPWLYALDLPGRLPAESYITHDGQLLSMTPVNGETHYATVAWLDATVDVGGLAADEQAALLELPPGASPRLQALGHELAAREAQPAARAAAVLAFFSEGGFRVDAREAGVRGPDAYDRFAYERRAGGADQFAGAFVLLARAAGLPARLVTGYHGGRLMGSSDYVLVKQSHAHAWAELWLPGRGWSRFDPADALRT